jgi:hypothetical protein
VLAWAAEAKAETMAFSAVRLVMVAGAVLSKMMETMARSAKLKTAVPRRVAARTGATRMAVARMAVARIGGYVGKD